MSTSPTTAHDCMKAYLALDRLVDQLKSVAVRGIASTHLTLSQFNTLRLIVEKGPIAQRDIAHSLMRSGGNVTIVVDNLERLGLATRERDTKDRRVVYVSATTTGKSVFQAAWPLYEKSVDEAMRCLSEKDYEAIDRISRKVLPAEQPTQALVQARSRE